MRFLFVALMLSACGAPAASAAAPTPPANIAGNDALALIVLVLVLTVGMSVTALMFYLAGSIHGQSASSKPQPYSQGLYRISVTREEFHALMAWRERQRQIEREEVRR